VWKGHSVDNNVKAPLTFVAPIVRQMETSSIIALSTTHTTPTTPTTEKKHRNVRLAFGDMQENPNLKLRNNI